MDFMTIFINLLCFLKEVQEIGFHFFMSSITIKCPRRLTVEAEQMRNEVLKFCLSSSVDVIVRCTV